MKRNLQQCIKTDRLLRGPKKIKYKMATRVHPLPLFILLLRTDNQSYHNNIFKYSFFFFISSQLSKTIRHRKIVTSLPVNLLTPASSILIDFIPFFSIRHIFFILFIYLFIIFFIQFIHKYFKTVRFIYWRNQNEESADI